MRKIKKKKHVNVKREIRQFNQSLAKFIADGKIQYNMSIQ